MTELLIRKLLIANRGEIACRIMRTCREMGIATVGVFSEADARARHVREADEAIYLGPSPPAESYLNVAALIEAAQRSRADAIHPGYGFLAENAGFARACAEAGFVFVGPPAEVIASMGNKREARQLMAAAGVPVLPGFAERPQPRRDGQAAADRLRAEAEQIGYPLLVKAVAGGGGKGMRWVTRPEELAAAVDAARREAVQAFGNDELLLEKALTRTRHVEFQIFGDAHGNLIHLGERECSIQRRHQKIIEETPSTALTPELRRRMAEAALTAGRALNYVNAGTVEFVLEGEAFYFLEVNTRLQVEHPVTELVTGLDLVRWQILVAEGRPLPLSQEEVTFAGHAIEARLYAENPARGFLPVTGRVLLWREAEGPGLRTDAGLQTGDAVSRFYDPLLAKIVAHGPDRAEALRRLAHALGQTTLLGFAHNLEFLRAVILHPAHLAGELSTDFIERRLPADAPFPPDPDGETVAAALIAAGLRRLWDDQAGQPPHLARYWRNSPNRPPTYRFVREGGQPVDVAVEPAGPGRYHVELGWDPPARREVTVEAQGGPDLELAIDGHRRRLAVASDGDAWWVKVSGRIIALRAVSLLPEPGAEAAAGGSLRAAMPGRIVRVHVRQGQAVRPGQRLVTLEAMKMEHAVTAGAAGVVTAIFVREGEVVEAEARLVEIADPGGSGEEAGG